MGKIVHFEIPSDDPDKSLAFYRDTFGWKFNRMGEEEYWLAEAGPTEAPGINGAIMKKMNAGQPLTTHIGVANLDEAMEKVKANGGEIVVPKTIVPNMGAYAFFKDPDGNILGIWEPGQM